MIQKLDDPKKLLKLFVFFFQSAFKLLVFSYVFSMPDLKAWDFQFQRNGLIKPFTEILLMIQKFKKKSCGIYKRKHHQKKMINTFGEHLHQTAPTGVSCCRISIFRWAFHHLPLRMLPWSVEVTLWRPASLARNRVKTSETLDFSLKQSDVKNHTLPENERMSFFPMKIGTIFFKPSIFRGYDTFRRWW